MVLNHIFIHWNPLPDLINPPRKGSFNSVRQECFWRLTSKQSYLHEYVAFPRWKDYDVKEAKSERQQELHFDQTLKTSRSSIHILRRIQSLFVIPPIKIHALWHFQGSHTNWTHTNWNNKKKSHFLSHKTVGDPITNHALLYALKVIVSKKESFCNMMLMLMMRYIYSHTIRASIHKIITKHDLCHYPPCHWNTLTSRINESFLPWDFNQQTSSIREKTRGIVSRNIVKPYIES
jgi:hypothetical protein